MSQPKLNGNFAVFEIRTFYINFIGLPILLGVYRKIIYRGISANYYRRAVQFLAVLAQKVSPYAESKFVPFAGFHGGFVGSGKIYRTFGRTGYGYNQRVRVGIFITRLRSLRVYAGEVDFVVDFALSCVEFFLCVGVVNVAEQIDYARFHVGAAGRQRTAGRYSPTRDVVLYVRSGGTGSRGKGTVRYGSGIGNRFGFVVSGAVFGFVGRSASRHND